MDLRPKAIIYTDGACRGNPGAGGWAALIKSSHREKVITGASRDTTNNRMELTAALEALKYLKRPHQVDVFTDSQYLRLGVIEWMKNWKVRGWKNAKKKPVKNQDLWKALDRAMKPHDITWHWVQGHVGNKDNERVDRLARKEISKL